MFGKKIFAFGFLVLFLGIGMPGCSKDSADENKPVSDVKAEADKMDVAKLKSMAAQYKDAILAKQGEIDKIAAKIKEIPITEALGEEAKGLKSEIEDLNTSLKALKERLGVYVDKLKEKGEDASSMEI